MSGVYDRPTRESRVTDGTERTTLNTGVRVSAREAIACVGELLKDLHAVHHDGEAMLAGLHRACRGQPGGLSDPYSKARFRLYLDSDGQPRPLVRQVLDAAVKWDGDHLVLICPFAEQAMRQEYESLRRDLAAKRAIPSHVLLAKVDTRCDETGKDFEDARMKDEASGRTTPLTSGIPVPVELAKQIMFYFSVPLDEDGRLDDELLSAAWKFCHEEWVSAGQLSEYRMVGLADAEGLPDPVFKAVVTAAVRWDAGGKVVLVSPFAETAMHAEYEALCRDGGFGPVPQAGSDSAPSMFPPWSERAGQPFDRSSGHKR
jgi:hypothetical protein